MADAGFSQDPFALTEAVKAAILTALDDEYHAEAVYAATLEKIGADVRPFCNIINAERRHQTALFKLMEKYQIEVPPNGYLTGDKPLDAVPDTLQEVCAIGVAAEIENARLYDEDLLSTVSAHEDIGRVSTALGNASIKNHLPAFQRCADGRGHGKRIGLKMGDENQETAN